MNTPNSKRIFFNEGKWAPLWSLIFVAGFNSWLLAMFNKHWETGLLWISFGGILALLNLISHAHRSAKRYYLWFSATQFIANLSLLDLSCQFAFTGVADDQSEYIGGMILTWLTFLVFGILDVRSKLREGRKYLVQAGTLNLMTAEWDTTTGVQLDNAQETMKKMSLARKLQLLSPLMPPLAFFISRNFSSQVEHLVLSAASYIVLLMASYDFGYGFMMCFAIPKWEREIGKAITIKTIKS